MITNYRRKQNIDLLKAIFLAWKNYYYKRKNDWKLIIRANIHYSYHVQNKFFKTWRLYLVEKRKRRIQNKISCLYHTQKIKYLFFIQLRYNIQTSIHRKKMQEILTQQFIFCSCRLEIIICTYIAINLKVSLLAKIFYIWKSKSVHLKKYFDKLLNYTNYSIIKKNYKFRVDMFLRSKYDPEILRPYFKHWIDFTNYTIIKKEKLNKVLEYYKGNLLRKSLNQLVRYQKYRYTKRSKIFLVRDVYERRIKLGTLLYWRQYVKYKLLKTNKINAAVYHNENRLIRKCFLTILNYKNYKQNKKAFADVIRKNYLEKLCRKYFCNLEKYVDHRHWKLKQSQQAHEHYNYNLKKYFFDKIKRYCSCKKRKKHKQNLINHILQARSNKRNIKLYFDEWKYFIVLLHNKKKLQLKSESFHRSHLLNNVFLAWKNYTTHRILENKKNECITQKIILMRWRNFVRRETSYRHKLEIAKSLYQQYLLSKGLRFLMVVGREKQALKKQKALVLFERKFQLQLKYYYIWKTKVFDLPSFKQCKVPVQKKCDETIDLFAIVNEEFNWNDLCFQKPKVPENLCLS